MTRALLFGFEVGGRQVVDPPPMGCSSSSIFASIRPDLLLCAAHHCGVRRQIRRDLHRDKEVAGENIVVKVIERRWGMKLQGGYPSVGIRPMPAARGDAFHRLLKVP
jgi:hypothetical protein